MGAMGAFGPVSESESCRQGTRTFDGPWRRKEQMISLCNNYSDPMHLPPLQSYPELLVAWISADAAEHFASTLIQVAKETGRDPPCQANEAIVSEQSTF